MTPRNLLDAIEAHPVSIRAGTDSLVALYCWRRQGGDDAGFAAAVHELVAREQIDVVGGGEMRFRLTQPAFDALSKVTVVRAEDREDFSRADWNESAAAAPSLGQGELEKGLRAIFALTRTPNPRAVAADTLLKIWTMEGWPAADLRHALDSLIAAGDLRVQRGPRTAFLLTEQGMLRLTTGAG